MNRGQSDAADGRGVSPVIGVILMVAVAVILGSIVGAYALDLTNLTGEPAPTVTFSEKYVEGEGVTITVENSDGVDSERLGVEGSDPERAVSFRAWPTSGSVEAGDSVTFPNADGNEEFRVVWTPEGEDRSFVLTEFVLSGGLRVYQMEDGAVGFEAEEFSAKQPGEDIDGDDHTWEVGTDTGRQADASGGTYLVAEPKAGDDYTKDKPIGPHLDYKLDFESAGPYYIWVRIQKPNGNDDSVHAGLDGTLVSDGYQGMTVSGSGWKWTGEADSRRVKVDVPSPGVHTVNIWMREDGTPFDKVIVTDEKSYNPRGDGKNADGT